MSNQSWKASVIFTVMVMSSAASAQDSSGLAAIQMKEITEGCLRYGPIVAEAKLSKWKKSGKNVQQAFGSSDPYTVVSKIQQQQCVSVRIIQMLQDIKSVSRTKDAAALKVDDEIDNQMAIIEKTL